MSLYLLDTNICIYYLKGMFNIKDKINIIYHNKLFISEITVAELKYGAENSKNVEKNRIVVDKFVEYFKIIPIFNSLDIYAMEKARLRKNGMIIDDFDLLIGASAVANNMILVTANEQHFSRMNNITIENWTKN